MYEVEYTDKKFGNTECVVRPVALNWKKECGCTSRQCTGVIQFEGYRTCPPSENSLLHWDAWNAITNTAFFGLNDTHSKCLLLRYRYPTGKAPSDCNIITRGLRVLWSCLGKIYGRRKQGPSVKSIKTHWGQTMPITPLHLWGILSTKLQAG